MNLAFFFNGLLKKTILVLLTLTFTSCGLVGIHFLFSSSLLFNCIPLVISLFFLSYGFEIKIKASNSIFFNGVIELFLAIALAITIVTLLGNSDTRAIDLKYSFSSLTIGIVNNGLWLISILLSISVWVNSFVFNKFLSKSFPEVIIRNEVFKLLILVTVGLTLYLLGRIHSFKSLLYLNKNISPKGFWDISLYQVAINYFLFIGPMQFSMNICWYLFRKKFSFV